MSPAVMHAIPPDDDTIITLPDSQKIEQTVTDWLFDIFGNDIASTQRHQKIMSPLFAQKLAQETTTVAGVRSCVSDIFTCCQDDAPKQNVLPSLVSELLFDQQHQEDLVLLLIAHSTLPGKED